MSDKITFFYEDTDYRIQDSDWLYSWLEAIFIQEGKTLALIEFVICSDDRILEINKEYLDHDYFTDIITFPLADDPVEATIFISIDRVRDNADKFEELFVNEFHRVMAHGILHLTGYNDKTEEESNMMQSKENEYLIKREEYKSL